ncbi:DUF4272 domain-containing protein [Brevibacillus ruminantium]|uniref:DUF4272 domain-containing protein n=1 Tax=Brevibacillus ruminantium TaxID=2950604 RepID=A0ABY4WIB3_9BACL|nr:DUF4272 domain-containing protein [Brevibacillus ruminantium]USG66885.1 DUF4272 domain-containing protein [Brevibacillus ruminantium]
MTQCTLYVSMKHVEKVTEAIRESFRDQTVEASADGCTVTVTRKRLFGKRTITLRTMREDKETEAFTQMIRGMYGFFSQIETVHEQVKEKLLMQITALNIAVGIVSSHEMDDETFQRILAIAESVNGIVFLPSGEMLDKKGQLILGPGGESELEDFLVTVSTDLIDGHVRQTASNEERKRQSMERLRQQGIPVIEHLPVIVADEEAVIRSKDEIVQRAIALCLVAVYAGGIAEGEEVQEEREFIEGIISQYGAAGFFTERERAFLGEEQPDRTETIQLVWMYECYWVLLWALGYVEELDFPGQICDVQMAIDCLKEAGDYDGFYQKAVVRSTSEILDQADLIYRYDWACVNARINNQPVEGGLNDEVVLERHRALNWLIRYMDADWDDVRTDT